MPYFIAAALLIPRALWLVTSFTMAGCLHVLPVVAIVIVLPRGEERAQRLLAIST